MQAPELTRDDVLRLIKEHGGPEGLDLSGRKFQQGIDLHEVIFHKACLEGADLRGSYLVQTSLVDANLKGAILTGANLQGAYLTSANLTAAKLDGANLNEATLENARLSGACLRNVRLFYAILHNINWGDFILDEELSGRFEDAILTYRSLKAYHRQSGIDAIAGRFYYREKEAQRKLAKEHRRYKEFLWLQFFRLFAGYGEEPLRIVIWYMGVILFVTLVSLLLSLLTTAQTALAAVHPFVSVDKQSEFPDLLQIPYYLLVSLTSLGYGNWVHFQGTFFTFIGPFLSGLGAVTIGLFVGFLVRKSGY